MLIKWQSIKELLCCLAVALMFIAYIVVRVLAEEADKEKVLVNNILVTADHIDPIEGFTKIYTFEGRDEAIYVRDEPSFKTIVEKQNVNIEGLSNCKIVESSEGEFRVETQSPELIVGGLSGTYVYSEDNSKVLGFVIELKGGKIRCLTIN